MIRNRRLKTRSVPRRAWRPCVPIFALSQSLALFDFYQTKILECDRRLEVALKALEMDEGHDVRRLPKVRTKGRQVNTPDFEVRTALYRR